MAWYDFGSNIYDWMNPPKAPAVSKMLAPNTEAKAAQYLIQNQGMQNPVYPNVTPYTQQLVRQGGTAYKPPPNYTIPTPGGSEGPGMTADQYRYWQTRQPQQQQQQQAQRPDYSLQIAQMDAELRRQQMAQQAQQSAAQLAWEREQQQADLEAQKQQRLAQLASQPKSWLEYAALSGQAPVVQPWMLPLMKGDYGITSAGSPIPNYSPTDMTNMPDLIPPSAQYMARIGPTGQQQLYGYEQAVHGATPDESQWRQWSMAPPGSGSYRGLQMQR